jgi:hypothetical protein
MDDMVPFDTGGGEAHILLGEDNRYTFYIWRPSTGHWINYSRHVRMLRTEHAINKFNFAEAQLYGISDADKIADIQPGNLVAIYIGSALDGRYVIDEAGLETDKTCRLHMNESTGQTSPTTGGFEMALFPYTEYKETTGAAIISALFSAYVTIDGTDTGGSTKANFRIEKDTKGVPAIISFCKVFKKEWWIEHSGIEDDAVGVDILHIEDSKGSSAVCDFRFSGANRNCSRTKNTTQFSRLANSVYGSTLIGKDKFRVNARSFIYNATTKRTLLNGSMDTKLATVITGQTIEDETFTVVNAALFPSGVPFYVLVGIEIIKIKSRSGNVFTVDTRNCLYNGMFTGGSSYPIGMEVIQLGQRQSEDVYLLDINVESGSALADPYDVYIGSEIVSVASVSGNVLQDCRRDISELGDFRDMENLPYAHLDEAPVYTLNLGFDDITRHDPEVGSSIYDNGLRERQVDVRPANSKHDIDILLQNYLDQFATDASNIDILPDRPVQAFETVVLGDGVNIYDANANLTGQEKRIVKYVMVFDPPQIELKFTTYCEESNIFDELLGTIGGLKDQIEGIGKMLGDLISGGAGGEMVVNKKAIFIDGSIYPNGSYGEWATAQGGSITIGDQTSGAESGGISITAKDSNGDPITSIVTADVFDGAAIVESNLISDDEEEANTLALFTKGTIYIWEEGKLEVSYRQEDNRVVAVAGHDGKPIVLGAEPVKVIGAVEEGDFLVTSDTRGVAMACRHPKPGTVIAQSLETSYEEGVRCVKAMIRKM